MTKAELDYNKLLDDWAEIFFAEAEEFEKKIEATEVGSMKYVHYKGK